MIFLDYYFLGYYFLIFFILGELFKLIFIKWKFFSISLIFIYRGFNFGVILLNFIVIYIFNFYFLYTLKMFLFYFSFFKEMLNEKNLIRSYIQL